MPYIGRAIQLRLYHTSPALSFWIESRQNLREALLQKVKEDEETKTDLLHNNITIDHGTIHRRNVKTRKKSNLQST